MSERKHKLTKKCWCNPIVLRPSLSWGDALLFIQQQNEQLSLQKEVIEKLVGILGMSMKFYVSEGRTGIGWYQEAQTAFKYAREKLNEKV